MVQVDPNKLKKYQVTMGDLINALEKGNINMPGGTVEATAENNYMKLSLELLGSTTARKTSKIRFPGFNVFAKPIFVKDTTVRRGFERKREFLDTITQRLY